MGDLLLVARGAGLLLWGVPQVPRWWRTLGLAVFSLTSLCIAFALISVWIRFVS